MNCDDCGKELPNEAACTHTEDNKLLFLCDDCYLKRKPEMKKTEPMMIKMTWFKDTGKYYSDAEEDVSWKFKPGCSIYDIWEYVRHNYGHPGPYCLVEILSHYSQGPHKEPRLLLIDKGRFDA